MTLIRGSHAKSSNTKSSNAKISNKMTRFVSLPVLRGLYGLILSLGAPVGWVILQKIAGRDPFSERFFDPLLYAYMSVATAIVFSALGYAIGRREHMITDLALTDSLTALYNKRYYMNRLEQEFEQHQRYGTSMAVIQIDLDFFKQVNDQYGHQAGDEVLKKVAGLIMSNCRKSDTAARVGGEEMSIIVCGGSSDEAKILAERIRYTIEHLECFWQSQRIALTASFGVAFAGVKTESPWQVYQNADKALYRSKQGGRNQVSVYE
jgi:diguanylate cyclase (GGDEF)-like protein